MFLKGLLYYNLAMQRPDEEPERISKRIKDRFGHKLPKLWEAFKRAMSDPELDKFDDAIAKLHNFENIRYPDELAFQGGTVIIGFEDRDSGQRGEADYQSSLAPIDRLVSLIFKKSGISPDAYTRSLSQEAAALLIRDNEIPYKTKE